uniref:Uncharacterized protein n=1 Tax=Tanacetum cinerariifolium TaxID=118510 RepID=A0A699KJ72_TANCI|nr:hypothetical protein [Tanacetum cinerariifolium]
MVDIPDDEDLVDHDGDDEEPKEEPKQQIGYGNQFAQHPNLQPGNMNGWLEEDNDDWEDDVEWLMAPVTPPRATEIKIRVQQVESRVDTYSSGQMAVPGQDEIVGLSQQERLTVLEKRLPGPPSGPQ